MYVYLYIFKSVWGQIFKSAIISENFFIYNKLFAATLTTAVSERKTVLVLNL